MLRRSLEAGAEHALLLAFGDNQPRNKNNGGLEFQYREAADGPCTGIYPPQPLPPEPDFPVSFPDVWLKLIRDGDTITGQSSQDGERWKTFCVHQQRLPQAVYLGLAVTSHDANQTVRGRLQPSCLPRAERPDERRPGCRRLSRGRGCGCSSPGPTSAVDVAGDLAVDVHDQVADRPDRSRAPGSRCWRCASETMRLMSRSTPGTLRCTFRMRCAPAQRRQLDLREVHRAAWSRRC